MKVVDMAIDHKNVFFFYTYFFFKADDVRKILRYETYNRKPYLMCFDRYAGKCYFGQIGKNRMSTL